jgi:hypothetical protein
MDFKKVVVATGLFTTILITSSTQAIGAQQKRVANVPPTEDGGMVYTASDLASLTPAARPGDVISPEALLAALHDSVSGPPGPVDWNRFRSLFLPAARLGSSRTDAQGVTHITTSSVEELITSGAAEREKMPWYEVILVKHIEKFDNIAVAYYSHDDRPAREGNAIQRSVNICEMLYDGKRWWIHSASWDVVPTSMSLPPDLDPLKQTK